MTRVSGLLLALPLLILAAAAVGFLGLFQGGSKTVSLTREGEVVRPLNLSQLGETAAFGADVLRQPGIKLVNFWASWCVPCRIEHPMMLKLAGEGIPIYGINFKDDPENALAFLESLGDPYERIAADPDGKSASDWGVFGLPETYVVDGNGVVILRLQGPVTERVLAQIVRPAIEAARESR